MINAKGAHSYSNLSFAGELGELGFTKTPPPCGTRKPTATHVHLWCRLLLSTWQKRCLEFAGMWWAYMGHTHQPMLRGDGPKATLYPASLTALCASSLGAHMQMTKTAPAMQGLPEVRHGGLWGTMRAYGQPRVSP